MNRASRVNSIDYTFSMVVDRVDCKSFGHVLIHCICFKGVLACISRPSLRCPAILYAAKPELKEAYLAI